MSEFADVNISVVNDVWIKQMVFRKVGDKVQTHSHVFPHQTLVATGGLLVTVNGVQTVHVAPSIIVVAAKEKHVMEALAPDTIAYCIHAMRDPLVEGIPNEELVNLA